MTTNNDSDGCLALIFILILLPVFFFVGIPFISGLIKGFANSFSQQMQINNSQNSPQPQYVPVPQQPQYIPVPVPVPQQPHQTCNAWGCGQAPNAWGASPNGVCTAWGCPP